MKRKAFSYPDSKNVALRSYHKRSREYEDKMFALGSMETPPCFCCGYNGPGYYQPSQHICAARHHKLPPNAAVKPRRSED